MARIVTITADIRAKAQQAFDDLLSPASEGGLAREWKLVYPPRLEPCAECLAAGRNTTAFGGASTVADATACGSCDGSGLHQAEASETLYMQVEANPARFAQQVPAGLAAAGGLLQIKCFAEDVPKVMRAESFVLEPTASPAPWRYVRDGEPISTGSIVQNRYYFTRLRRAGG